MKRIQKKQELKGRSNYCEGLKVKVVSLKVYLEKSNK